MGLLMRLIEKAGEKVNVFFYFSKGEFTKIKNTLVSGMGYFDISLLKSLQKC